MVDDPLGMFSRVLENVLHVEDIRGYNHYKIKGIGDSDIHRDLEKICRNDLSLKPEFAYLERLNLVKHVFYTNFDNQDWIRIILSRIHDDLLWLGDSVVCIDNDLIHKVTSLSNKGSNLVNTRNAHKIVEANLNTHFDRRNMKVKNI